MVGGSNSSSEEEIAVAAVSMVGGSSSSEEEIAVAAVSMVGGGSSSSSSSEEEIAVAAVSMVGGGSSSSEEEIAVAAAAANRGGNNKARRWKCMAFIIGNEAFEKVASFGVAVNLTAYLVSRFKVGQLQATNIANIFLGSTNLAPLLGAFVSDAYLGRFRTLAYGSFATLLGLLGMTLSASVPALRPAGVAPSLAQQGVLYLSLGLLTVGAGAIRPCSLPFGVDQFDQTDEDSLRGLNNYFNWYYGTTTAALVFSMTVLVYIQNVSWAVGFAIPTALMLLSIALFFVGAGLYVHVPPEGSIFSGIAQVMAAAFRKRRLELPDDHRLYYSPPTKSNRVFRLPLTSQFAFLNKAAIVLQEEDKSSNNSDHLCSVQQIEEVKCLIRIVPIWVSGVLCFVAPAQQFTFIVKQATTMDRHLGPRFEIPPGSILSISFLALTLFIPVYDRLLVPAARRLTGVDSGITLLQRQGIGLAIAPVSMVVAGLVERRRRSSALAHGGMSPMSVMWLAPQLALMGVAEAFNAVGQIEFYNKQFPEHMQTLAGSLFFCGQAGSSFLSSALVSVAKKLTSSGTAWLTDNINEAKVDYYFYVIAIMGLLNLFYFLVCSHYYRYKGHAHSYSSAHQQNDDSVE